jgi:epoxyqueuosine reductase
MAKVLLHDCCAPCGAYVLERLLQSGNEVSVYFFNSNIFPENEFEKRKKEMKDFCFKKNIEFIEAQYIHGEWQKLIIGKEQEPEKGERCKICIKKRLEQTADYAKKNRFSHFATTLSISPHKDAEFINSAGKQIADKYGLVFIDDIWRKNGGYKKSVELSNKLGFYRQKYCGCEYSLNPNIKSQKSNEF